MREGEFITPPMSVWLDLVRGLAALAVVVGHGVRLDLYTGPYPFTRALEKNAVVVFFVLSGLVIAASIAKRRDSLSSYAIARLSRILPVALGATLVALVVAALDTSLGDAPLFAAAHRDWADPVETLQAVLFLSESHNSHFALNPPHWSLCYEVWFYAIFAAATFLSGRSRVVWLMLLAAAAGPNVLLLLPTWLVGVWIARSPTARTLPKAKAWLYVTVALASLFILPSAAPPVFEVLRSLVPWTLGYSLYALTDFALALAVALGFVGLRTLSADGFALPPACEKPIRFLAGISFSLYLLHWPLQKLMRIMGIGAGESLVGFAAIVLAIVAVSAIFATATEYKRYTVRSMLEKRLRTRRPALGTA